MLNMSRSQAARFLADKLHYQMFDFIDARRHYVFVSCLVAAGRSSTPVSARLYLTAEHRRRCPRIAQFVLFVIKIPNVARAAQCRQEFDRDTANGQNETGSDGADVAWLARDGEGLHGIRRILCWPPEIIYYPSPLGGGNTKIFVRDYCESAERSIWYGRASWRLCYIAVFYDEFSVDIVIYERS